MSRVEEDRGNEDEQVKRRKATRKAQMPISPMPEASALRDFRSQLELQKASYSTISSNSLKLYIH